MLFCSAHAHNNNNSDGSSSFGLLREVVAKEFNFLWMTKSSTQKSTLTTNSNTGMLFYPPIWPSMCLRLT
ncbi:uncharacterized protein LOC117585946 isoform X2 [Drosophila guanche]|uniref:uncharacterized protein LOC117585946 isoform X2 n=1 Tax=Drosophila guanche TaxID=7266 RepID=UPI001470E30B|nr:uncharacterized protein LOC117585946 isoform X2 [Drosophila guanche]